MYTRSAHLFAVHLFTYVVTGYSLTDYVALTDYIHHSWCQVTNINSNHVLTQLFFLCVEVHGLLKGCTFQCFANSCDLYPEPREVFYHSNMRCSQLSLVSQAIMNTACVFRILTSCSVSTSERCPFVPSVIAQRFSGSLVKNRMFAQDTLRSTELRWNVLPWSSLFVQFLMTIFDPHDSVNERLSFMFTERFPTDIILFHSRLFQARFVWVGHFVHQSTAL